MVSLFKDRRAGILSLAAGIVLFFTTTAANAQLIFLEDFNYCCGNINGQGGWTAFSSPGLNPISITGGLNYGGYAGSGIGQGIQIQSVSGEDVSNFASTSLSSGSIYFGFLLNVSTASGGGPLVANFIGNQSTANSAGFSFRAGGGGVQFGFTNGQYTTTAYNFNQTYLVVLEYVGTSRTYSLYVNPPLMSSKPAADKTYTHGGSGSTVINSIGIYQNAVGNAAIDGIRVSKTWSDIVGAAAGGGGFPITESFNYNNGDDIGLHGWNPSVLCCTTIFVNSPGLTQPSFGGSGNAAQLQNSGTGGYYLSIPSVSSGSVYVRFLINYNQSNSNNTQTQLGFYSSSANPQFNTQQGFNLDNGNISIKYGPSSGNIANYVFIPSNTTQVLVLEYNISSNQYSLYFNPIAGSLSPNGMIGSPQSANNSAGTIDGITLIQDGRLNGFIDEIVVSPIWADVVALAEPSSQPTNFFVNSVGSNSANFNFSPAASSPNGYVVFRGTGLSPTSAPVDNANYIPGQVVGDATVISIGSSTTVFDTPLNTGTTYYYNIYSYNTDFGTQYNYRQSAPLQGIIAIEPCCQPTSLAFSNVATNQMDLTFTPGGLADGYLVLRSPGAYSGSPVDFTSYNVSDLIGGATVAYNGTLPNFTDTGLTPGIDYYYQVFSYSGSGTSTNYNVLTPLQNHHFTFSPEPTTQATNITFSSLNSTSYTLNWTPGNGVNYLVLGHQTTTVSGVPTDGTLYTPNVNFGTGSQIGSGNFVVYDGSGTSVTVAGLIPNNIYFFQVFTYNSNGNGSQNYLTSTAALNPNSRITLATAPTIQATAPVFTAITSSSYNLTWANGNGANRIVVARLGSAPNSFPVNGTSYTANSLFGSGTQLGVGNYVVYSGSSNTVAITGLTSSTIYYFDVFEYSGTAGIGNENYLTTVVANQGSQSTLATAPSVQASFITFSAITNLAQTVSWTSGNGARRIVFARATNAITATPVNGTAYTANTVYGFGSSIGGDFVVYDGTGSSVTVTGLTSTTVYNYKVYEYNGTAGLQNYYTPTASGNPAGLTTVAAPPVTQASALAITATTSTQQTLTWVNGTGTSRMILAHATTGVNSSPVNGASGYTGNSNFGTGTQIGSGNYIVYDGAGTTVTVTNLTAGTVYNYQIFEYNGTAATANYLTSPVITTSLTTWAAVPTVQSTSPVFSAVTDIAQTLTWTSGNGARRLVLAKAATAVSTAPTNATAYTANSIFGSGSLIPTGNYVVYDGTGNTVTITGLTAGTIYNYQIFEYNGTTTSINYLAGGLTASQTTLASVPSTQTSALLITGSTVSQQALSWTNGNGANRIVLARSGAAVNSNPVSGTGYTANSVFGSGTAIGGTNYVVYAGSGTSVTVTGLAAGTVYYYQVYEFNGSASSSNYLTAPAVTANQTTWASPPTIQSSAVAFSAVTDTQQTLTWTIGNGARRLVLAKAITAVSAAPANASSYSANATFGAGALIPTGNYVVYDGTGNTVTVTGLSASTVYNYQIFEYNGTAASINYLAGGVTANQTTLASLPSTQASSIVFSNLTTTAQTLTWTSGNGANRIVVAFTAPIATNPVNGTSYTANTAFGSGNAIGSAFVVYNGSGNTVTVTGLAATTVYYYKVFEFNGAASTQNYLTSAATGNPASQTTVSAAPGTQASSIGFSGITQTQITVSWTNGTGTRRMVLAHSLTPVTAVPANGTTYTANSAYGSGGSLVGSDYVVYDGTSNSVAVTGLSPSTTVYFQVFEYNGSAGTQGYNITTATLNPNSQTTVTGPPTIQATSIVFSSITNNSMTVSWTVGNGSNHLVVASSGTAVTATPSNGTVYAANAAYGTGGTQIGSNYAVYNGSSNSVNVTGLSASTVYYFQVFESTGAGATISYLTSAATGNPANQTTVVAPPITQATNLVLTNVTHNSLTLNWTIGDGTSRLVLAKAGSAISSSPANSTGYTANPNFSSGTQIGSGNYVVYDGTGTTVNITGLSPATAYYFEVYEYKGSGSTSSYLTSASTNNPNNTTTLATPPTLQASNIVFSALSNTQMDLSWTTGNGVRRLVLARANLGVNATPANANSYTANSVFSSGTQIGSGNYVVYDGTGSSFTLSGLTPSTNYYFQIFEYNGTSITSNYLLTIAANNPALQSSLANPVVAQASAIVFSAAQNSQLNLGWTNGSGAKRVVLAHAGAAVNANPANGTTLTASTTFGSGSQVGTGNFVVFNGTAGPVTVTGLSSNTNYYFQVFEYNGAGADNNYNVNTAASNPLPMLTLTDPPVAGAATNFGQTTFTANWSSVTGATGGYFIDVSSDNFATTVSGFGNLPVTPTSVNVTGLTPGTTYKYQVRAANSTGSSGNSSPISVLTVPATPTPQASTLVTATAFTANWTASATAADYFIDVATDAAFASIISSLNPTTNSAAISGLVVGTNYYYRVRARNASGTSPNSSPAYNQITAPAFPLNLRSSSITSTSFLVQWDAVTGASSYELDVMDEFLAFIPGYQAKSISTTFASVSGLIPAKLYVIQVRAVNAGGKSANSAQQPVLTADASGGGGGQIVPPQISLATTTNLNALKATVVVNTGINNTITYYHRKIADKTFTAGSPVSGNSLEVTYDPNNDLDAIGMEYYFKAKDALNRADSTGRSYVYKKITDAPIPNLISGGTVSSYRIIAIPLALTSPSIDEVFKDAFAKYGGYNKEFWRILQYKQGAVALLEYGAGLSSVEQGKGYWFNSKDAITISVTGSAGSNNQNSSFKWSVVQGFTQVGNPYNFTINFADILSKNPSAAGAKLYTFNGGSSFTQATSLKAWEGGFISSTATADINIPVTVSQAGRVSVPELISNRSLGQPDWILPMKLMQGDGINDRIAVGMHPDAKDGADQFDQFEIPRFIQYLELDTHHPDFVVPYFSSDIVRTKDSYSWNFSFASNLDQRPAILVWDNYSLGINDSKLVLYDEHRGAIIDMKNVGQYTLDNSTKTIRIFYGATEKDLQPDINALGVAYPNPFMESTTIPFLIGTRNTPVQIEVFDMTGRRVRSLVNGNFDPGRYATPWNGQDEQGQKLPQGIYLYRMSGNESQTRKLMIR